jgi:hypothetical protein
VLYYWGCADWLGSLKPRPLRARTWWTRRSSVGAIKPVWTSSWLPYLNTSYLVHFALHNNNIVLNFSAPIVQFEEKTKMIPGIIVNAEAEQRP